MSARVSEIEVTNALSKALGLPSTVTGFNELLARVQQAPSAMREAMNGDFTAYVMANGGAELIRKVETENVRLAQEARKDDPKVKYTGVTFDAFGRPIHGGVLAMAGRGDRGGSSGQDRSNYQSISYASAQSLSGITSSTYNGTPFAAEGVTFGTFNYLRSYDRNFTGQDILSATNDVKTFGFGVNDRRAMRNQATLRHYDNKPEETVKAQTNYSTLVDGDPQLAEWMRNSAKAATPQERKYWEGMIEQRRKELIHKSGLEARKTDPKNSPKAAKAIEDFTNEKLQHKREQIRKLNPTMGQSPEAANDRQSLSEQESAGNANELARARQKIDKANDEALQKGETVKTIKSANDDLIKKLAEQRAKEAKLKQDAPPTGELKEAKSNQTPSPAEPSKADPISEKKVAEKPEEPKAPAKTTTAQKPLAGPKPA